MPKAWQETRKKVYLFYTIFALPLYQHHFSTTCLKTFLIGFLPYFVQHFAFSRLSFHDLVFLSEKKVGFVLGWTSQGRRGVFDALFRAAGPFLGEQQACLVCELGLGRGETCGGKYVPLLIDGESALFTQPFSPFSFLSSVLLYPFPVSFSVVDLPDSFGCPRWRSRSAGHCRPRREVSATLFLFSSSFSRTLFFSFLCLYLFLFFPTLLFTSYRSLP